MTEAIGIRLDDETLQEVNDLSEEEATDRSTVIRKLLTSGLKELRKEKACAQYREGKTTFSAAAKKAGLTAWDFEQCLIRKGYTSSYSVEDLQEELDDV